MVKKCFQLTQSQTPNPFRTDARKTRGPMAQTKNSSTMKDMKSMKPAAPGKRHLYLQYKVVWSQMAALLKKP